MTMHAVLIAPAAFRAAGNALSTALGYGDDTYSVPLYPATTPAETPTHYGASTPVTADFVALVQAAEQGNIPPALEALGYTGSAVQSLIQQIIVDFSNAYGENDYQHWMDTLAVAGLSRYPVVGP